MFSHIVANTCPRLPSRFETSNRFSVDIRPDFPVPYFTKKLQLQIWQCPLALLTTFFGVKTRSSDPSMKSHKDLDEIPGKLPRASFCHVCLYFSCPYWLVIWHRKRGELSTSCHISRGRNWNSMTHVQALVFHRGLASLAFTSFAETRAFGALKEKNSRCPPE